MPQSSVTFGQAGLKRDDPDWYAAQVLNEILGGGGFRGRLMKEIREKRGLAYGVSTGLVPYRYAGLILGSVATENGRVAESIALIRQEWQRMRDEGPTEDELRDAKILSDRLVPARARFDGRVAGLLVRMQRDGPGIDYLDRRAALISAVTLDQARAVARRFYDPSQLQLRRGRRPGRSAADPPGPGQAGLSGAMGEFPGYREFAVTGRRSLSVWSCLNTGLSLCATGFPAHGTGIWRSRNSEGAHPRRELPITHCHASSHIDCSGL